MSMFFGNFDEFIQFLAGQHEEPSEEQIAELEDKAVQQLVDSIIGVQKLTGHSIEPGSFYAGMLFLRNNCQIDIFASDMAKEFIDEHIEKVREKFAEIISEM